MKATKKQKLYIIFTTTKLGNWEATQGCSDEETIEIYKRGYIHIGRNHTKFLTKILVKEVNTKICPKNL